MNISTKLAFAGFFHKGMPIAQTDDANTRMIFVFGRSKQKWAMDAGDMRLIQYRQEMDTRKPMREDVMLLEDA